MIHLLTFIFFLNHPLLKTQSTTNARNHFLVVHYGCMSQNNRKDILQLQLHCTTEKRKKSTFLLYCFFFFCHHLKNPNKWLGYCGTVNLFSKVNKSINQRGWQGQQDRLISGRCACVTCRMEINGGGSAVESWRLNEDLVWVESGIDEGYQAWRAVTMNSGSGHADFTPGWLCLLHSGALTCSVHAGMWPVPWYESGGEHVHHHIHTTHGLITTCGV